MAVDAAPPPPAGAPSTILHLAPAAAFAAARAAYDAACAGRGGGSGSGSGGGGDGSDGYAPADLPATGFVHCAPDTATLRRVANHFYAASPPEVAWVVLVVAVDALPAGALVWEAPAGVGATPHSDEAVGVDGGGGGGCGGGSGGGGKGGGGEERSGLMPHVYGPLPWAALDVYPATRAADGTFTSVDRPPPASAP
ncbi:hypothetical protein I4F81_009647 [Pyropia yezoensis]|uniref:Uncharacterized protein n=1 Tax=Pyropia yezoensis TaxID=2788 RepID=A0ACC3CBG6_PYRYE|nr:hypothetical protein I4F81_009647 [Neopyropia yezoensis]